MAGAETRKGNPAACSKNLDVRRYEYENGSDNGKTLDDNQKSQDEEADSCSFGQRPALEDGRQAYRNHGSGQNAHALPAFPKPKTGSDQPGRNRRRAGLS